MTCWTAEKLRVIWTEVTAIDVRAINLCPGSDITPAAVSGREHTNLNRKLKRSTKLRGLSFFPSSFEWSPNGKVLIQGESLLCFDIHFAYIYSRAVSKMKPKIYFSEMLTAVRISLFVSKEETNSLKRKGVEEISMTAD